MAFGLVHGFVLLGWIDVLFEYGLYGLALFSLRKLPARRLALIGLVWMAIPAAIAGYQTVWQYRDRTVAARVEQHRLAHDTSTAQELLQANRWTQRVAANVSTPEMHQAEIEMHRSGYLANLRFSVRSYAGRQSTIFWLSVFDIGMMMVWGMALLKWGVLTAERSRRFYLGLTVLGFGAGLALKGQQLYLMSANQFDPYSLSATEVTYHLARFLVALGFTSLVMLVARSDGLKALTRPFAAVGRMALTNYIMQTVVCVLLFYGFGFGLFARLERWEVVLVAAGIWAFQLVASPIWLRRFRFGPLEWLWRSLTYRAWQPLGVEAASPARAAVTDDGPRP
jgi:uncharacterized protein